MKAPRYLLLAGISIVALSRFVTAQMPELRRIPEQADGSVQLDLEELFRVGSLSGTYDSFGRVMSTALSPSGRLYVADDKQHTVIAFDSRGRFLRNLGRRGGGPGEFEQPWLVAVDPFDSIYVWDAAQARVSVFGPDMQYRRSFRVPAHWAINSMAFPPTGEIVLAAMGGADDTGVQVLARDGTVRRSFMPIERNVSLAGFETSLLGGSLDIDGHHLVYSRKSPFELSFYRGNMPLARCRGSDALTTRPQDAIEVIRDKGAALHWNRYIHSASVVLIDSALALNVIMDPTRDRRIVDLVTRDCRLVRRTNLSAPITIVDRVGNRVAAVSNVEYPEVIVYSLKITRARE